MHKNYSKYEDSWARNVEISKEKKCGRCNGFIQFEREDIKCVRWMKEKHENFIFFNKKEWKYPNTNMCKNMYVLGKRSRGKRTTEQNEMTENITLIWVSMCWLVNCVWDAHAAFRKKTKKICDLRVCVCVCLLFFFLLFIKYLYAYHDILISRKKTKNKTKYQHENTILFVENTRGMSIENTSLSPLPSPSL